MPGTVGDFIQALTSQIGVPYVFGGDTPEEGFDCSGLVYWAAQQCGVTIERSSEDQWGSLARVANPETGDVIFFNVPADDQDPPQHEGVFLSTNQMIEAPHTGGFVQYSVIPNDAFERIMGYGRISFANAPMPPVPKPPEPVTPTQEDGMATADPISGGEWVTDATGAVDSYDGAPYLGGLNNHPEWKAGTDQDRQNPCVGMAFWKGDGTDGGGNGYVLFTRSATATQASPYRFPRDGKYIKN